MENMGESDKRLAVTVLLAVLLIVAMWKLPSPTEENITPMPTRKPGGLIGQSAVQSATKTATTQNSSQAKSGGKALLSCNSALTNPANICVASKSFFDMLNIMGPGDRQRLCERIEGCKPEFSFMLASWMPGVDAKKVTLVEPQTAPEGDSAKAKLRLITDAGPKTVCVTMERKSARWLFKPSQPVKEDKTVWLKWIFNPC